MVPWISSYCPTAPKLVPPKVGDSVLVMTICFTRALTGCAQLTTAITMKNRDAISDPGVSEYKLFLLRIVFLSPAKPKGARRASAFRPGAGDIRDFDSDDAKS